MDASGIERITKHNVQVDDVVGYFCPTGAPPIYHTVVAVDRFADAPAVTFDDGSTRYLPLGIDHRLIGRICRSADELEPTVTKVHMRVGGEDRVYRYLGRGSDSDTAEFRRCNTADFSTLSVQWQWLLAAISESRVIILAEQPTRTVVTDVNRETKTVTYTTEPVERAMLGDFVVSSWPCCNARMDAIGAHRWNAGDRKCETCIAKERDERIAAVVPPSCPSCHHTPCEYSCARGGWARYQAEKREAAEARRRDIAKCRAEDNRARIRTDGLRSSVRDFTAEDERRDAREASAAAQRPFRWVVR